MPAPAPSANTFVTNLRLLDLDVLPDWPQITAETWTAKDQNQSLRQRIRGTEWALYRLFELYDGHLTHEKFSQHFPPLEPQQSKNLRDSLYRELTQLKKDGVLPPRVSILRTTLEECKWEKVADVLLFFSTLVVKRICLSEERGSKTPRRGRRKSKIPQKAIARSLAQVEPNHLQDAKGTLLPLTLAHEASLGILLRKKQEHREKYSAFSLLLDEKSEHVVLRQEELEHMARLLNTTSTTNPDYASLKRQLQENWFGNTKWLDALIHGESQTADDVFFGLKDREIWKAVVNGREPTSGKLNVGLVEELEKRVRRQEQRLKGWKSLRDKLGDATSIKAAEEVQQKVTTPGAKIHFTAHQNLKIGQPVSRFNNFNHKPLEANRSFHYAIMDMEAELEQVSKSRKQGGAGWSTERASVVWIAPAVIKDQEKFVKDVALPHKPTQAASSRLPRGPKTTGLPTRTNSVLPSNVSRPKVLRPVTELSIGTNTSSIFSKPSVSGQASTSANDTGSYFPPLNSASLAALSSRPSSRNETRRRPTLVSLSTDTTLVPPPRDDDLPTSTSEEFSSSPSEPPSPLPSRQTFNQPRSQPSSQTPSRAPDVTDQLAEELGRLSVSPQSVERRLLPTERTRLFLANEHDNDADEETPRPKHLRQLSLAEQILNSVTLGTPSPTKKAPTQRPQPTRHLSLAERTRLSMAQAMNPHISPRDSDSDDEIPALPALTPQSEAPSTSTLDRRASLMERTRQSMALAAAQHQQRPKPQQRKSVRQSRQSIFPVNQFETPAKRQTINWDAETVEEEGEHTPKEKLFEEDVDMASVFKSRPKIALSPVLTPVKGISLGATLGGGSDEGYES